TPPGPWQPKHPVRSATRRPRSAAGNLGRRANATATTAISARDTTTTAIRRMSAPGRARPCAGALPGLLARDPDFARFDGFHSAAGQQFTGDGDRLPRHGFQVVV